MHFFRRLLFGRPIERLEIDGRAAILICPECGDLGCGAVLARILVEQDRVTWSELVHANNYN